MYLEASKNQGSSFYVYQLEFWRLFYTWPDLIVVKSLEGLLRQLPIVVNMQEMAIKTSSNYLEKHFCTSRLLLSLSFAKIKTKP